MFTMHCKLCPHRLSKDVTRQLPDPLTPAQTCMDHQTQMMPPTGITQHSRHLIEVGDGGTLWVSVSLACCILHCTDWFQHWSTVTAVTCTCNTSIETCGFCIPGFSTQCLGWCRCSIIQDIIIFKVPNAVCRLISCIQIRLFLLVDQLCLFTLNNYTAIYHLFLYDVGEFYLIIINTLFLKIYRFIYT